MNVVYGQKSFLSTESDTKILQSIYFAYKVGIISSYSNRIKKVNTFLKQKKNLHQCLMHHLCVTLTFFVLITETCIYEICCSKLLDSLKVICVFCACVRRCCESQSTSLSPTSQWPTCCGQLSVEWWRYHPMQQVIFFWESGIVNLTAMWFPFLVSELNELILLGYEQICQVGHFSMWCDSSLNQFFLRKSWILIVIFAQNWNKTKSDSPGTFTFSLNPQPCYNFLKNL